ncbi:YceD family protein [Paraliomyxa miuraensis]|uniref:YceD family protein n=1 Tax=Paraliomyxa miuraensis TaxID=376150 RepID=UPI00225C3D7F|nr:DUF177 domain-containing protein [Paraliomyxa miuraensis]MCX4244664.1 DUF177 domain-containing protein [Paraliomyxa miuraensis]
MARDLQPLEALRVDLAALRRRGVDLHPIKTVLPQAWLTRALGDTDAELSEDAEVALRLTLQPEGVVLVQGSLSLRFSVPCGRCLSPAAVDGATEIFATFMASAAAAQTFLREDEEGWEPDPDAPDVFAYDGPILTLDAMVAEQVALAYPMRALCERGEQCRGLCSNCGFELNALEAGIRHCPQCRCEVPLTPVAEPSSDGGTEGSRSERDNPFAQLAQRLAPRLANSSKPEPD